MIQQSDLQAVRTRPSQPGRPMLSVYLDVDQSRMVNRNRAFESALETMFRSQWLRLKDPQQQQDFESNANRVRRFVSGYTPNASGLVMFCDESQDFFWHHEVHIPIPSELRWSENPYLQPILEAFDEYQRVGVILADKNRGHVLTVFLGEIEEHLETFATANVKHFKKAGSDHSRSQMQFQRKANLHTLWHLKKVVGLVDQLAHSRDFERLLLAGTPEVTSTLKRLLSKRLRSRVIASIPLRVDATPQEILNATLRLEQGVERTGEVKLVEDLIASAAKALGATTGIVSTLSALDKGQIRTLVYAEGAAFEGSQCWVCERLYGDERRGCGYCSLPLQPVPDLLGRIIERVVQTGGDVEQVRGEAAEQMKRVGSIGAFLRFKTLQAEERVASG
jgi:peptide chain release factor subunit 1